MSVPMSGSPWSFVLSAGRLVPAALVLLALLPAVALAAEDLAGPEGSGGPLDVGLTQLVAAITAIGALGTAAFSLVDATKAFGGGVSNAGLRILYRTVGRFSAALEPALGRDENANPEWKRVVRAHWINGRPRDEQKAIVKSLIRLGLSKGNASALAAAVKVKADTLEGIADKLEQGTALDDTELNVLGRLDASVDAQLDAAYDAADQLYRNWARVCAAIVSLGLGVVAARAIGEESDWKAFLIGLLAVPLAPIAKDLASSLQAAAAALRSVK